MRRVGVRAAALCWAGLALGGCAATEKLIPSTSGGGSVFGNLLAFNTTTPGPVAAAGAPREDPLQCPTVQVLDGTAAYRTYAGSEQSNATVRYQFSMGEVARECTKSGKDVLLKVGVEGRVLLGPAGSPGAFTVPIRIAVRRNSDGKAVTTKLYQVPATIGAASDATAFQIVSDPIAVAFVTANADDDYTILVGFDAAGQALPAAPGEKARRRGARSKEMAGDAPRG